MNECADDVDGDDNFGANDVMGSKIPSYLFIRSSCITLFMTCGV